MSDLNVFFLFLSLFFCFFFFLFFSQVDFVIKEATNLDNLAQLYEGWTAWVWRTACAWSLSSSTGLEINQIPEGQWRSKDTTQPIRGLETGAAADSALPKLLGSQKGAVVDLVALLQPHSPTICYWAKQCYVGLWRHPLSRGSNQAKPCWRREVSEALKTPPSSSASPAARPSLRNHSVELSESTFAQRTCWSTVCRSSTPPPPPTSKESTQQSSRSVWSFSRRRSIPFLSSCVIAMGGDLHCWPWTRRREVDPYPYGLMDIKPLPL